MSTGGLSSRSWVLGGAALAVVLLALTWFVVVAPTRSDAASLRESAADIETQNSVLATKLATLERESEQRGQLSEDVKTALASLPPGTRLPVFSRQLADQANARGIALTGFSVGSATVPGAEAEGTTTLEASPLLAIPVTVTSSGPALEQLYFLRDLQQVGPRLALVSSVSLAPGQGDVASSDIADSSTLTVQLTVFTHRLPADTRASLVGLVGDAADG